MLVRSAKMIEAPVRLVTETRSEFRAALLQRIEELPGDDANGLRVDLARTVEIDASGLGVLVVAQKSARERAQSLCLVDAGLPVRLLLARTRLEPLFEFSSRSGEQIA
jgi:anti-anti-sigma regulatory factor